LKLAGPSSPVDTLMLMYDECGRRDPLGPDEYFLVTFDTVEVEDGKEGIERYSVHVFADGTIIFLENGEPQRDDQAGYACARSRASAETPASGLPALRIRPSHAATMLACDLVTLDTLPRPRPPVPAGAAPIPH
jgi:hypothetical protein